MLRLFIFLCAFLVLGAGLYHLMFQGAGYVLIVWGQTSIEMSIWTAFILLLSVIIFLFLLIKIYSGSFKRLVAIKHAFGGHAHQKAHSQMLSGLTDFIEEDWSNACKKLERSAHLVDMPMINYLVAARSAYELNDEKKAMHFLHQAEKVTGKVSIAIPLTQAKMQLANRQYEQALATLERVSSINAEHPAVINLKRQAYLALKDWSSLKKLLPLIEKISLGSQKEREQLSLTIHQQCLLGLIDRLPNPAERLEALKQYWRGIPNTIKQDQYLLALYVRELMAAGDHDRAERILADGIDTQWQEHWVRLYGSLNCSDHRVPLAKAEQWLKHQKSEGLYFTLGRLCAKNEQWGRAVDYFNQSLQIHASKEVFAELAKVQEQLEQFDKSQASYKKGLLLALQDG